MVVPYNNDSYETAGLSIEFGTLEKKYTVSSSRFREVKSVPVCVITPETALPIAQNDERKHYKWTELSNLSGATDYFKHPRRQPDSEGEDYDD